MRQLRPRWQKYREGDGPLQWPDSCWYLAAGQVRELTTSRTGGKSTSNGARRAMDSPVNLPMDPVPEHTEEHPESSPVTAVP
jgi:hypothetical protein